MPSQIILRSPHGDLSISYSQTDTIIDVCRKYALPVSQFTTYIAEPNGDLTLVVKPMERISSYIGSKSLILLPNRNIDYSAVLGSGKTVNHRDNASTWITSTQRKKGNLVDATIELLSPTDALSLVSAQVKQSMLQSGIMDEPLVVGVSGGGDSNALLHAIVDSELVSKSNIYPVMMLGVPDWDTGVERAKDICNGLGLKLRIIESRETAKLLGFSDPDSDWVTSFEKTFPEDDLEVLGVYGVRRVLTSIAKEVGADKFVVGTNLEDCLADTLYYICHGRAPFPQPLGKLGDISVFCPLWLTPKPVIDGCFPRYSRENYEARYPSRMFGRAYYYYLAQMISEIYPGAAQQLLSGASKLIPTLEPTIKNDPEFGFQMHEEMPLKLRVALRKLFQAENSTFNDEK